VLKGRNSEDKKRQIETDVDHNQAQTTEAPRNIVLKGRNSAGLRERQTEPFLPRMWTTSQAQTTGAPRNTVLKGMDSAGSKKRQTETDVDHNQAQTTEAPGNTELNSRNSTGSKKRQTEPFLPRMWTTIRHKQQRHQETQS
jgi:hypothetical protein